MPPLPELDVVRGEMRIMLGDVSRTLMVLTLTCVLLAVATGCGWRGSCVPSRPNGLTEKDLVGRGQSDEDGAYVLNADGTFSAADIPASLISGENTAETISGHGTWTLEPDKQTKPDLALAYVATGASPAVGTYHLYVSGRKNEPWLVDYCDSDSL